MSDYRCTQFCPPYGKVLEGKAALLKEIRRTHPRAQNIYKIVSKRGTAAHSGFFQIFNGKCCYCGCSVNIMPAALFEVDHLKPKIKNTDEKENLDALNNLVLACCMCNSGKLAYWNLEISNEWSPENNGIAKLFFRDILFNILVNSEYQSNPDVMELYKLLKLEDQFRRLDYLLMSICGYLETLPKGSEKRIVLLEAYQDLLKKRNYIGI